MDRFLQSGKSTQDSFSGNGTGSNSIDFLKIGAGFTLIEMMVVVSIMAVLATVFTINLNSGRDARNLAIAQNQLVSNIRLIQSNSLSSRALSGGQAAQYDLLKFDLTKPGQYTIEGVYNAGTASPQLADIQTVLLPSGVFIATSSSVDISAIDISRSSLPTVQPVLSGCALVAFSVPFGKAFLNDGCNIPTAPTINITTDPTDDYGKILNYLSNNNCLNTVTYAPPYSSAANPPACSLSTDSTMSITLTNQNKTIFKKVLINAITGNVCPTMDGATCQASY